MNSIARIICKTRHITAHASPFTLRSYARAASTSVAVQSIANWDDVDDSGTSRYSEAHLQTLYNDLFAPSVRPQPVPVIPIEPPRNILNTLLERFDLQHAKQPAYKTILDRIQQAVELIAVGETPPRLGLVLDLEWEVIIKAALDKRDMEYVFKGLGLMTKLDIKPLELDKHILAHAIPSSHIKIFTRLGDKFSEIGYPLTPERLSAFIDTHLRSTKHLSFNYVQEAQNLLHSFEAQGTPASQSGYGYVIKAYLDLARESSLLSGTTSSTNPSAAIAAIHDLFTHMRYVVHPSPSLKMYSLVILACSRGRYPTPLRALELLKEVRDGLVQNKSVELDTPSLVACYNGAIRACARAGPRFAGDAFQLAKELVQRDGIPAAGSAIGEIGPDRATMTALIHSSKRMGDLGRTRWILTEVMRAQASVLGKATFPGESEPILDEEIMVCAFQAYASFRSPISRKDIPKTESQTQASTESFDRPTQPPHTTPQSPSEILLEADALFSRVLSKQSCNHDPIFIHVPLSARIINAYMSVYFSHAPLRQAIQKHHTLYGLLGMPEPNIYSFIALLEQLASASKPDRAFALVEATKTWSAWLEWAERLEDGYIDPVLAEVTPRAIERIWAAMIKIYSLCDNIDSALTLLRDFVSRYPPSDLKLPGDRLVPVPCTTLEHQPPTKLSHKLSDLLTTPPPRTGLLVRFVRPGQVTEPGIMPHLLFTDLALLHHRLVSRHSHRQADIAFVTWVCKAYELQIKRRRAQSFGRNKN